MWYGLICNGELISVKFFNKKPTILDFNVPFSSLNDYQVGEVTIHFRRLEAL